MLVDGFLEDAWVKDVRGRLTSGMELSKVTWFRVGGKADVLYQPADEDDLSYFLANLPQDVPVTIIGVGSNLLVRDSGVRGVVIRLSAKGFGGLATTEEGYISCGVAVPDKRLAAFALDHSIGGFAFYHGIPGAVGGALRMNAGASGNETADRVVEVHALDRIGRRHVFNRFQMDYKYRSCGIAHDYIFTRAVFSGEPMPYGDIVLDMEAVQHHRETVQPVGEKTGGSTFKNPDGHSAWKLIDEAGCRGLRVGGAQMSELHCNFMINTGDATAFDLESLGEEVRKRVFHDSGVLLEWEIKRLGAYDAFYSVQPFLAT